jgi:hypothetical protein
VIGADHARVITVVGWLRLCRLAGDTLIMDR